MTREQAPFRYKRILPNIYQIYHRKTKRLIGAVQKNGNKWDALSGEYDANGYSITRMGNCGTFKSRGDAASEVWIQRDTYWTDRPYGAK